ncbi:hypothetical protein ZWY2020_012913 [Hordeum vulgare]|nr:hypothetical protein ZWY2020_012913 [Hordeum vulgare]
MPRHARAVQAETNPSWSLRLGVVHSSSLVELYIRIYGQLAYVRSCGNFSCQYIWFPCIFQGNKDTLQLHFDGHSTTLAGVLSLFGCEDHNGGIYIADLLLNIRTLQEYPSYHHSACVLPAGAN